ncbi:MAG TPA: hypothetical protein VFF73_29255 [Planctomycetota bacterium]|nr:hypothetical protein [Planctomycetota bacterium]
MRRRPSLAILALAGFSLTAWGQEKARVPGEQIPLVSLAFTPDGKYLAAGDARGDVSFRDPSTGQERKRLQGGKGTLVFVGFADAGKTLVSVDQHSVVLRRYPHDEDEPAVVALPDSFPIECAALASSASALALGVGKRIVVLDLATRKETARLAPDDDYVVKAVALSADGKRAVSGDGAGHVRVWDVVAKKLVRETEAPGRAERLLLSPDARTVALPGKGTVLLDLASGRTADACGEGDASASAVSCTGFMAAGGRDGSIEVLDPRASKVLGTLHAHESEVRALAFSPDGRALASIDRSGTLVIFDVTAQVRPH